MCLPAPALEKSTSICEQGADLVHVAQCKTGCGCIPRGSEGQRARVLGHGCVVEDSAVERRVLNTSCIA